MKGERVVDEEELEHEISEGMKRPGEEGGALCGGGEYRSGLWGGQ
jgi:hypothetical protein